MTHSALILGLIAAALTRVAMAQTPADGAAVVPLPERERIAAALPKEAFAKPAKPRKLLVFSRTAGYRHDSIPVGIEALLQIAKKTGAFEVTASEDSDLFERDRLAAFDAVLLLNTTGEIFSAERAVGNDTPKAQRLAAEREARLKDSLLEFVRGGKGLVGIHAATDCFYQWPDYGAMIGGYFDGHPWNADTQVTIQVDDPGHPLCRMFDKRVFPITDEIYQLREPYARQRQRVLLRLNTAQTDMTLPGIHRTDGDFAISWLRSEGRGRVFYCSLGHRSDIYWNPAVLGHYLAGIQYALGDLPADATPIPLNGGGGGAAAADGGGTAKNDIKSSGADWRALFNGKDLTGWKGLVGDPIKRAAMKPAESAAAQKQADEQMRAHWSVEDGVLRFDGAKEGSHLCTVDDFADFELKLEWKIGPDGDSGVYLRGCPQVQIWDVAKHPEGSGGLYNNEKAPKNPSVAADKPAGEWNRFHITLRGERVSVRLNDKLVVDEVPLENYWTRGDRLPARGQIEFQSHMSPLWFRNIEVRGIVAPPTTVQSQPVRQHEVK